MNNSLTALAGVRVGHWTNPVARTGCTAILMPPGGAVASCEVRGGAPGTRDTALLEPSKAVERIHAILFSGGSAFGLAAASGVMTYLESVGEGLETPAGVVPIVPTAVIYDLYVGSAKVRPGFDEGLAAARAASSQTVPNGAVGAGIGALCGKYLGVKFAEPGGLGNASLMVGGAMVSALAVVNPHGDLIDDAGLVLAGANPTGDGQTGTGRPGREKYLEAMSNPNQDGFFTNTTLLAVGTNAPLSKLDCKRLAEAAQAGFARAIWPSHTLLDGDTSFAFSVGGGPKVGLAALMAATQLVVASAIRACVTKP